MPSILQGLTGNAATDLTGYGGSQLTDQVNTETDEERKRRLKLQQQMSGITATGTGSALGGLGASTALFGGYGR